MNSQPQPALRVDSHTSLSSSRIQISEPGRIRVDDHVTRSNPSLSVQMADILLLKGKIS